MKRSVLVTSVLIVASTSFAAEKLNCSVSQNKILYPEQVIQLTKVEVDERGFMATSGSAKIDLGDARAEIEVLRLDVPKPYSGTQYFVQVSAQSKNSNDSVAVQTSPGIAYKVKSGTLDLLVSCSNAYQE